VPAHVEAERLLLPRELLALGPGGRVGERHGGRRVADLVGGAAEELMLPFSRSR
jgi:hypothetical protein